jgi:hypothetical protein
MGTINKIELDRTVGQLNIATRVEGELAHGEVAETLGAMHSAGKDVYDEDRGDDGKSPVADAYDLFEQLNTANASYDAALGAVRILASGLGLASSSQSNVAKLAKQVHAVVQAEHIEFMQMYKEIANLDAAMRRFGFDPPPLGDDLAPTKRCQILAHHLDEAKRRGMTPVDFDKTTTREGRMNQLAAVQKQAQLIMVSVAMVDGFVNEEMTPDEMRVGTQRWVNQEDARIKNAEAAASLLKQRSEGHVHATVEPAVEPESDEDPF